MNNIENRFILLPIPPIRFDESPLNIGKSAGQWYALTMASTFLHECGHALAASLLFANANPKIQFSSTWPGAGSCTYNNGALSHLGQKLGVKSAASAVSAAGTLVDLATILAATIHHRNTRNPNGAYRPLASRNSLFSIDPSTKAAILISRAVSASIYALSAFFACTPSHDFCQIRENGHEAAFLALTGMSLLTTIFVWKTFADDPARREPRGMISNHPTHRERNWRLDPLRRSPNPLLF